MKKNYQINIITYLLLSGFILFFSQIAKSQTKHINTTKNKIQILPLLTHGGTPSAGCYIQDENSNVYCQLLGDEVYFNTNNIDEIYKEIKSKISYPKEYTYGFSNGKYSIFIKEIPVKKEGCITTSIYRVLIRYKKKTYNQELSGFCGC